MENPIWNFTYKAASAIGLPLFVAGAAYLCLVSRIDRKQSRISYYVGARRFVSLFASACCSHRKRQAETTGEGRYRDREHAGARVPCSEGRKRRTRDALFSISEYLREKASLTQRVADGRLHENFAPFPMTMISVVHCRGWS